MNCSYFRTVVRFVVFISSFLLLAGSVNAQILDDSTKLVYGPATTHYLKEENILYNNLTFTDLDTSVVNSHRWSRVEKEEYKMQDLGVSGTAIRSIYPQLPVIIGARPGFSVYSPYYRPVSSFKYFDTKSPYSKIDVAIGGRNRTVVDVGFNRSDSSNFNIGIDYFNTNSDKQVSSKGKNDRLVRDEGYDAYLVYFTKNRRYLVMGNFSRLKTQAVDQGGIDTLSTDVGFFDRDASVFLANASSEYLKRTFHLYHQFRVNDGLQAYQVFDRSYERSSFDDSDPESENYFDRFYINEDVTADTSVFETITLENGVKGTLGPLFYSGYYKYRIYTFHYGWGDADTLDFANQKPSQDGIEHYIGGRVRYTFNPEYKLTGGIDFNLNGNQRLWGEIDFKGLKGKFVTQQYEPTYMEQAYLGNHDYWVNDFKTIKALQIDGSYTLPFQSYSFLKPEVTFTTYTDYVYYDKQAQPQQIPGSSSILTLGASFRVEPFKHFFLEGEGLYTTIGGDSTHVFPIPELMANLNVYYHNVLFNGNLDMQIGFDNHWKSDYFAPDYRVSTNQYFIQDYFEAPSYIISDFYLNIKLGHAYVFFKFNNLVDAFTKETYFAAPNYVGKRALVDYGFVWMFFD